MSLTTAQRSKDILRGLPKEARDILFGYRDAKLKASRRWDISLSEKRQLIEVLTTAAKAQITELETAHRDASEIFTAEVGRARGKPSAMGPDEQMAWERLRSHLDAARRTDASSPPIMVAMKRLEKAQKDGDVAMLRAGRTMLADHLGEPLARDHARWLDIASGDAEMGAAVALDEEGRHGIGHVKGAIGWARGEIEGRFSANVMQTWDGKATLFDGEPDYAAADRAATADAGQYLRASGVTGPVVRTGGTGQGGGTK